MSNTNDPFGPPDDDRTIIRPNPGRRSQQAPEPEEPAYVSAPILDSEQLAGLNPLEKSASLLLNILGQIRNTSSHPNPDGLHQQFVQQIKEFETRASKSGVDHKKIFTARYILCTTVDEFVLNTPWGATSVWRNQSLLRVFHQETSGGEKFFLLLKSLIKDPSSNIELLELMYICLALGFQGRYRVESHGAATLEAVRENLYRAIRNYRGDFEGALSPHWEGVAKSIESGKRGFPMWAMVAIALAVSGIVFGALRYGLLEKREDLSLSLVSDSGLQQNLVPITRITMPESITILEDPRPDRIVLSELLSPEIQLGLVTVDEESDEQILIRLVGEGQFDSAQDTVRPPYMDLIERIGQELTRTKGRVTVAGHTDNVPMRSSGRFQGQRFPSNQSLSQARADEVARLLAQHIDPERLTAVGMADREPIEGLDGSDARNRRVEITVYQRKKGT